MEVAEGLHQVCRRGVARTVLVFRVGDLAVDQYLGVAGQTPNKITHRQHGRGKTRLVDIANHQRAGIDKRIARAAAFKLQLHQRVKRLTRGLMPQALPNSLAGMLDGLHQAEDFGDALHRERRIRIASAIQLAVVAVHRDTELLCRHIGQRRNVVGYFALANQRADLLKNFIQQRLHAQAHHKARAHLGRWQVDACLRRLITPLELFRAQHFNLSEVADHGEILVVASLQMVGNTLSHIPRTDDFQADIALGFPARTAHATATAATRIGNGPAGRPKSRQVSLQFFLQRRFTNHGQQGAHMCVHIRTPRQ